MICCIIDFGAPELNKEIEALYAEGLVLIGVTGSLPVVLNNNIENKSVNAEREIHSIYSLYEDIRNWSAYYNDTGEEFEDDADDIPGFNLNLPVQSQPKIGRNDPCPCGSGKKFKKCHGAVNHQFDIK